VSAYSYRLPRRYRYRVRRKGGKITREQAAVLAVVLIAAGAGTKAAAVHAHHAARPAAVAAARDIAASEAIGYARRQFGKPYLWGGTGPGAFDCSGLAMMAYRSAGVSIARTSQDQWATERHVPASQVEPGDLVFFAGSDGTMTDPGHVGIVIGGGKMIQALGRGYPVMVSSWHRPDLVGFTDPASLAVTTAAARIPANEVLANRMAASGYGWTGRQAGCLDGLWTHENDTWDPTRWNLAGSGAYGIPQALPASKMASAGPDWQTSAATQVKWGLGYIRDRYGTPCAAWAFERSHVPNWY
jgi:cell wall-associated NlpC family hydrolase